MTSQYLLIYLHHRTNVLQVMYVHYYFTLASNRTNEVLVIAGQSFRCFCFVPAVACQHFCCATISKAKIVSVELLFSIPSIVLSVTSLTWLPLLPSSNPSKLEAEHLHQHPPLNYLFPTAEVVVAIVVVCFGGSPAACWLLQR